MPRKAHPNFLAHKNTWKPGESGNPSGRPRQLSVWQVIRNKLGKEGTKNEVAKAYIEMLIEKNAVAWRDFLDRTEGKPIERIEVDMNFPQSYAEAVERGKRLIEAPRFSIEKPVENIIEAEFTDKAEPINAQEGHLNAICGTLDPTVMERDGETANKKESPDRG